MAVCIVDSGISDIIPINGTSFFKGVQSSTFQDDVGHGTMVAKTILEYSVVSFFICKFLQNNYSGTNLDFSLCIQWCIKQNVSIINCSVGTFNYNQLMEASIQNALHFNIMVIASAGNYASNINIYPFYPASFQGVVSVSALTNNTHKLLIDSNYEADLGSIGETTFLFHNTSLFATGTSVATARVTGLACKYYIYTNTLLFQKSVPTINLNLTYGILV